MEHSIVQLNGVQIPVHAIDTVIVGSGCAGYNAADTLYEYGRRDIAILTEGVTMGTSRNTGSDKQTFYKLSLSPNESDSVGEMAKTLFSCGGMHGDTALIEAAGSVRSFIKLVNCGVPFPTDRYGAYVGYKTDHDPRRRATSAGPYTSRYMTEGLERAVRQKGIRIFDGYSVVRLLKEGDCCRGVLAIDEKSVQEPNAGFTAFVANNVILATGGPAGAYATSVYPESQTGMTGMAIEAGARCENLMDWQYGLASTKFRWNVSGTYQQVIPRYIAIDKNGCEREFLQEYFDDPMEAMNMVFMKGYQWPFDVRKIPGSSVIDIIIHYETSVLGNRVYMDFTREPSALMRNGLDKLSAEAYTYLEKSNALLPLPIMRLAHMNTPAIELYADHGIDLYSEPLEVKVCAQHNNGGIAVDENWRTNLSGLYVAGEAAGTFGAYRPGGTALASTQTGSQRAAEHIVFSARETTPDVSAFSGDKAAAQYVRDALSTLERGKSDRTARVSVQQEMTDSAAHMRDLASMRALFQKRGKQAKDFFSVASAKPTELSQVLRTRDILITQQAMLSAMLLTAETMGSRGSGLLLDPRGDAIGYHMDIRYMPAKGGFEGKSVVTQRTGDEIRSHLEDVRPIPVCDDWFENVWKDYTDRRNGITK